MLRSPNSMPSRSRPGCACEGFKPVVAIYSTFLQRAYDQLIHDVALQNLPVVFALDRAGLVGSDGATHQGSYDLTFLRCIPNMVVMAPADENECRQMLFTAYHAVGAVGDALSPRHRPGRSRVCGDEALPVGEAQLRREGRSGLAILAFGALFESARRIAERLDATLVNMRFVKPLDQELISRWRRAHRALVTIEENAVMGGAGSAVSEVLAARGIIAAAAPGYSGSIHRAWLARHLSGGGRTRSGRPHRERRDMVGVAEPGTGPFGSQRLVGASPFGGIARLRIKRV